MRQHRSEEQAEFSAGMRRRIVRRESELAGIPQYSNLNDLQSNSKKKTGTATIKSNIEEQMIYNRINAQQQRAELTGASLLMIIFALPSLQTTKQNNNKMFNQLIHSSEREKFKRHFYNDFLKQTQQVDSDPPLFRNQTSLRDKQQKIYDKLLSNSLEGLGPGDLSQVIKQRLQSKKVEYPRDMLIRLKQPSHNLNTQEIQITLPDNPSKRHNHDSIKRSRRRRIKTNVEDCPNPSQEQSEPYKQTMKEIDELNHIFFTNSRRNVKTNLQYDSPQGKFYHISRQHDFQQYINHLEKHHERERKRYTPVRQRVREVASRKEEIKPMIRIELPASPERRKKENFIKILKKVKARGESLLVKLNKFPSLKHMAK